ncbi:flagellar hook-associated protein FlgL [Pseudomonas helleri]|uniref:Flagellar hook-associated protein 3 n=1 Tax=Pseudomonas helleri TaxID=1608996 RepID=A0A6A7YYG4_9PSED|nr:flagellar hook-associated protein FlgL [Pseudomonas helleri]MQT27699.1 flagellar hook-associated protein 3 [Pseudomonas helleri]MQT82082.1 flagellar hook-associated protein 3 [Pseudomonas helleri]MQU18781.1 flagellar hook-associated protein 3 [Pseudomonas helleri]MQU27459.1 flagellar hook-associated protein 3 [Pseudomonas helleri]
MRISNAQTSAMMHNNMNRNSQAIAQLQAQIGSGLRIQKPSDDPIASARLMLIQREQASLGQYNENIGKVSDNLKLQETYVQSGSDAMGSIRDLLLWAGNDSNSPEDLSAIATQLSSLEDSLVSYFNARDEAGNYVFSGTRNDVPAVTFDPATGTYTMTGNNEERQAVVGNGVLIGDNVTAQQMLGADADFLNDLHSLVDSLKNAPNDPATRQQLKDTLEQLDVTHGHMMGAMTDMGGRQNTLTLLAESNADVSLANQKVQGDLSQLDMGGAFLAVQAYELSMQASQKVYSRMATISLFDLM